MPVIALPAWSSLADRGHRAKLDCAARGRSFVSLGDLAKGVVALALIGYLLLKAVPSLERPIVDLFEVACLVWFVYWLLDRRRRRHAFLRLFGGAAMIGAKYDPVCEGCSHRRSEHQRHNPKPCGTCRCERYVMVLTSYERSRLP